MRKAIVVVSVLFLLAVFIVSCGSSKICPAYSAADVEQTSDENC